MITYSIQFISDGVETVKDISVDITGLSNDEKTTALESAIAEQHGDYQYYAILGES